MRGKERGQFRRVSETAAAGSAASGRGGGRRSAGRGAVAGNGREWRQNVK